MDTTLILVAAGLILGSVVLTRGVERLIRRLGVQAADPDERSGGMRDVLKRFADWQREGSTSREK